MNKFFDLNSPFMRYLSRLADMVWLSVLWFLCCLPVFTIGASTSALYYVALKLARDEEVAITACFFKGFKDNFKQGFVLNLIFLIVGAVLIADYFIMSGVQTGAGTYSSALFFVMIIWLLCIMFYAYPLQAQFVNTIRRTLMNAAILSMRKIFDTIIIFVLNMLPVILAFVSFPWFIRTSPIWIMLAPGAVARICASRFVKMFAPYLPAAEETEEEEEEEE